MKADDETRLLEVASRIADGVPVDWTDPATSEVVPDPLAEELKALETMARLLRGPVTGEADATPPALEGFSIERELGRGGTGVVYLARDQRLERLVAIKVLPPEVALDPDRLARIEREAKLLASLNHPRIAAIHGMAEDARGSRVLILEFVPGETLATRLARGPLALTDAVAIGARIAEALIAAHDGGVVHRDLKPANVMLGPHGRVKVLDFGIALRPGPGAESHPTIAGTWAYVSPECLTRSEDHRADVFAFGCVLYECLAGRRAFPGKTAHETLASVIGREPDWAALPADTPHSIRLLLEECLIKDPDHRLADLGRALQVLEEMERGSARPAVSAPPPPGLPHHGTSFVGRGREQTECRHAVLEARLVTLVGPGGSGKTRLAIEVAVAVHSRIPALWFVDLAPVRDPAHVPDAVASILGIHDDGRPRTAQLADRLRGGRALIILDNCEHVLPACADLVRALIETCPGLAILTTSREPLGLIDERRIDLPPLALPTERELADPAALARTEAVRLFVERARHADPGFLADAATLPIVVEICQRLDGLPLAIELAAARVSVLNPGEIAARLDRQLHLLRASGRPAGRHETMRATIAWSADQLLPAEASFFMKLAAFAGGWDLEAAHAVCTPGGDELEALDLLARLVDKSLVLVDRRPGGVARYRLLEPVRQFALERLIESGEHGAVRALHLAHFLAVAERAAPHLYGADQVTWIARLATDHDNILAALRTAEESPGGAEAGLRMVYAIRRMWITRGQLRLGEELCLRALERAGPSVPPGIRAHGLSALGAMLFRQNLDERSRLAEIQRQALELYREAGDRKGMSVSLSGLGNHAMHARDYEAARSYYEQSLAIDRELGASRGVALTTHNLGVVRWFQGHRAEAVDIALESDRLLRASGDRSEHANGSVNLAFFQLRLGRRAEARGSLLTALTFFAEAGSRTDVAASALLCAAEYLAGRSGFADAATVLGAAQALLAKTLSGSEYRGFPWDERLSLARTLEEGLGALPLAEALSQGRTMPPDEAFRLAIETIQGTE